MFDIITIYCGNSNYSRDNFYKKGTNMTKLKNVAKCILKNGRIVILAAVVALVLPIFNSDVDNNIYADTAEQIKDKAEKELKKLKEQMANLEAFKNQIASDLDGAAEEMESLLAEQAALTDAIDTKQLEIEKANDELLEAMTMKSESYETMKLRIQYMYENNMDISIYSIVLNAENISEVLSNVEYANSIYEADRKLLQVYQQMIVDVELKQTQLNKDMDELLVMQDEFELRQANLEVYMAGLSKDSSSYATQLANAKKQAAKYEKTIKEQERIIAAKKAAEEAARREEANKNLSGQKVQLGSASYLKDSKYDPAFTSKVTGDELVKYALQFVGNPYVWGGNSLTKGCDCSGFVKLIYQHFGFNTPRYSQSFKTYGKPVAFENIKAGDIVVYPGHVAIYMGNGRIVEALNSKKGITSYRLVTSDKITAIRRVL